MYKTCPECKEAIYIDCTDCDAKQREIIRLRGCLRDADNKIIVLEDFIKKCMANTPIPKWATPAYKELCLNLGIGIEVEQANH